MADIDVVPKRRSLTWVWILAAIVILALVVWALTGNRSSTRVGVVIPSIASPTADVAVVPQLLSA